MSVPLDRLYNFLDSINRHNGHDAIIYRFYPHGSRKIEDLTSLTKIDCMSWSHLMITPMAFYHDQEPLNFDYYNSVNCRVYQDHTDLLDEFFKNINFEDFKNAIQFKLLFALMKYNCYDYAILCHSEKNSKNLDLYENSEFVGVYWWSHAAIARDWYRYAEHDLELTTNFNNIKYDFLIYNRAWSGTREYRLKFSEMVVDSDLNSHCSMTFSPTDNDDHYYDHVFANQNLKIKRNDLEQVFPPNHAKSCASADYKSQDYSVTGIEVVLETLFDDSRLHLTEKTLRPIACGCPFMLAATPGSLEYLRSYGFETFNGLIDESYDVVQNPMKRLQAIIKEMQRIAALDTETKLDLWHKLYEIAGRNKKRFFSKSWHDSIFKEYQDNFDTAMKFMNQHRNGRRWKQVFNASKKDLHLKHYLYHIETTSEEIEFVNAWLTKPLD